MRRGREGRWAIFVCGGTLLALTFFLGRIPSAPDSPKRISKATTLIPSVYSVGLARLEFTVDDLIGVGQIEALPEETSPPKVVVKAMAISQGNQGETVVLVSGENIGIPSGMSDEVAKRLEKTVGLKRSQVTVTSTPDYCGPIFHLDTPANARDWDPDEESRALDRYLAGWVEKMQKAALLAMSDRKPSRLSWGLGCVKLAVNDHAKNGPVDHDLPMLVVKGLDGQIRAIYVNYACKGRIPIGGFPGTPWIELARDAIEHEVPGAMVMISIGTAADQLAAAPFAATQSESKRNPGDEIASEVRRLLSGYLAPVSGEIHTARNVVDLDYAPPQKKLPTAESKKLDLKRKQNRKLIVGPSTESSDTSALRYGVQSWTIGDSVAFAFLSGDPSVDYSIRLKKELDGQRLWVVGCANNVDSFIPSERTLRETAGQTFTDELVGRRAMESGLEDKIVAAVHQQLDCRFSPPFDPNKTRGSLPKSPQQSLAALQTTPNLRVDLIVAEPLISDPVAIDFGLDGALWVAEMRDYPDGLPDLSLTESKSTTTAVGATGGRIRLVRDRDGDGQFDSSTVFLDDIRFPTGVIVWNGGVLVCAAPDILYAVDTNGDDKADIVKTLFTGFNDTNIQARVNSLVYGLDDWIYGSCGLAGGTITNFKGEKVDLNNRDFRIKPETGEIEPAAGRTQQGRVRDDFGNWFGCDNLNMAFHYPLPEHYLKRNPFIASPPSRVNLTPTEESKRLFPARVDAQRFELSGTPGSVTAACGIGVYRDNQLGAEYTENLFVCEPVNLLVHRMVLKPSGTSFVAERAANENRTEFLRSTDSWFRPVQAVTGPDGALWVVDMYRYLIEDPRWIPENELTGLDVRAGTSMGRIYRVRSPQNSTPPATRAATISKTPANKKPGITDSPVYRELEIQNLAAETRRRGRPEKVPKDLLLNQRADSGDPIALIERFREVAAAGQLVDDDVFQALKDPNPRVRAFGLLMAEKQLSKTELTTGLVEAAKDSDPHLRLQAAFTLGEWKHPDVGRLLSEMALKDADDPYLVAAIFSSVSSNNLTDFTTALFAALKDREPPSSLMAPFLATAVGYNDNAAIRLALTAVAVEDDQQPKSWQLDAVANLVESLSKRPSTQSIDPAVQVVIMHMQDTARKLIAVESVDETLRLAAVNLLGRDASQKSPDAAAITELLNSSHSPAVQIAAVEGLERIGTEDLSSILADRFRELSPSVQPRVVDAFLNRESWIMPLFVGIEQGKIPTSALTAAQRQEVIGNPDAAIRNRATALFAGSINKDRHQVIAQYHEALRLKGNPEQGRAVFNKTCSQCHKLGDLGHAVGPNLGMVANKPAAFFLQEILDPNRNVDARYTSYIAATKSGLIRTGLLASESPSSITLIGPEGKKITLLRQDLDEVRSSGKSLMPEGLEKDLSPQAIADLIAFLTSTPAAAKRFEGNSPAIIKPVSGHVELLASSASIIGDQIMFEPAFSNVGYWRSPGDHVFWTVEQPEPATYDVYLEYSCDPDSAGNGYLLETSGVPLSGHVESTGGWDKYTSLKLGSVSLAAGLNRIVLRPDGAAMHGALFDLRGIYLVPAGEKFALAPMTVSSPAQQAAALARRILDDNVTEEKSEAIIAQYPNEATGLVVAMTAGMPDDLQEEYRRIPKIWQVAVACGKRNDLEQNRSLLAVALPKPGESLKDWQAVVIGGGIINGIGLTGGWPRSRIDEILSGHEDLSKRWQLTLDLASQMADDDKVNTGTRYDAMRIIALDDRPSRREQLIKYLAQGTHNELQMGAISGLSDIDAPEIPRLLIENIGHFNDENRGLAIGALLRFDSRTNVMLDALANGQMNASLLSAEERTLLLDSKNQAIKERAKKVLGL